jgi:hypothetical protein
MGLNMAIKEVVLVVGHKSFQFDWSGMPSYVRRSIARLARVTGRSIENVITTFAVDGVNSAPEKAAEAGRLVAELTKSRQHKRRRPVKPKALRNGTAKSANRRRAP